jgi:hypothetical protein
MRKNAKRELSFFFIVARAAGKSPKGSKGGTPIKYQNPGSFFLRKQAPIRA